MDILSLEVLTIISLIGTTMSSFILCYYCRTASQPRHGNKCSCCCIPLLSHAPLPPIHTSSERNTPVIIPIHHYSNDFEETSL